MGIVKVEVKTNAYRVKTTTGEILTMKETLKKNWQKNKAIIIVMIGAFIIGVLLQLGACIENILTTGNGNTWILFLKQTIGAFTTSAVGILSLLFGVTEENQMNYLKNNNLKIVDDDGDGVDDRIQ